MGNLRSQHEGTGQIVGKVHPHKGRRFGAGASVGRRGVVLAAVEAGEHKEETAGADCEEAERADFAAGGQGGRYVVRLLDE